MISAIAIIAATVKTGKVPSYDPEISKITPAAIAPIACPPLTKGSVYL